MVASSAAAVKGTVGTVTVHAMGGITADPAQADPDAVGSYLVNNTLWNYSVTTDGIVTQGTKIP